MRNENNAGVDLDRLSNLIADDGFAISFQSMSQYRSMLLREIEQTRRACASQISKDAGGVPERMSTDESREYLVKFMEQHFTDKTYYRYIRGERGSVNLAGDFAWQMAHALRMLSAGAAAKTEQAPCQTCAGKGGTVTSARYDPESGPEYEVDYCGDCGGLGRASAAGAGSEQQGASRAALDEHYQEVLRPILSRKGMQRYLNGDSIELDPSDYRAIIDRAALARAAGAGSEQAIKTWQERMYAPNEDGLLPESEMDAMEAEIRDLRAALARAPLSAQGEKSQEDVAQIKRAYDILLNTCGDLGRALYQVREMVGHPDNIAFIDRALATAGIRPAQPVDDARDQLEQLLIEKRIGITPENEGGFHAFIYGDQDCFKSKGYGTTPSKAIDAAMRASRPDDKGEKA